MYSALTNKLKNKYDLWTTLNFYKIFLILMILTLMRDIPSLQILSLYSLQLISNCLLIKFKPYEQEVDNRIAIINDLFYTTSIIFYMIASDYTLEFEKKQYAGHGLAAVLISTNVFNLCIFLKSSYTQLKQKIQLLRKRMQKSKPEPKIAYKIPTKTVTQN